MDRTGEAAARHTPVLRERVVTLLEPALPQMAKLLAQDRHATSSLDSGG